MFVQRAVEQKRMKELGLDMATIAQTVATAPQIPADDERGQVVRPRRRNTRAGRLFRAIPAKNSQTKGKSGTAPSTNLASL